MASEPLGETRLDVVRFMDRRGGSSLGPILCHTLAQDVYSAVALFVISCRGGAIKD